TRRRINGHQVVAAGIGRRRLGGGVVGEVHVLERDVIRRGEPHAAPSAATDRAAGAGRGAGAVDGEAAGDALNLNSRGPASRGDLVERERARARVEIYSAAGSR